MAGNYHCNFCDLWNTVSNNYFEIALSAAINVFGGNSLANTIET